MFLSFCYFQLLDTSSQVKNQLKNSDMRFATEQAFRRSVLKAELFLSRSLT